MYRCHPQIAKVVELLRAKAIGDLRTIEASFAFNAGFNPEGRMFANHLGGGGILDVGCYPVSIARLIAGVANGGEVADPIEVKAVGHLGETGIDEWTVASLKFPGDILAQVATGCRLGMKNDVMIYGSEGRIHIPTPWLGGRDGGEVSIFLNDDEIKIDSGKILYAYEADMVGNNIANRQAVFPAVTWADTLGNMRTLDAWRRQIGLVYDSEKPENVTYSIDRKPVVVDANINMQYGQIPGLDKKVSRTVMGVDNQDTMPHAAVMWDDFYRKGGNCFDTSWHYGAQRSILLGHWMHNRGIRDEMVVLAKGAHTPMCWPGVIDMQVGQSCEWMKTDYLDIFLLHRDNLDVPVGEFVDALNEQVDKGKIKVFGGSNWSLERVDEANAYARKNGKQGFSIVSNSLSLAIWNEPVWGGCYHCGDKQSRDWLKERQLALMSWSSQARGFFVVGDPDYTDNAELVRCYYNDDNFKRLERARELAKQKGVEPINIALAYVLNQPFPTFGLIGPRILSETESSLKALDVKLTQDELDWLCLDKD